MSDIERSTMENRKNKVLLVSVIFGALFVAGLIILGIFTVRYFAENFTNFNSVYTAAGGSKYRFQDAMRDLFSRELELPEIEILAFNNVQLRYSRYYLMEQLGNSLLIVLFIVIAIPAFITNILGWHKNSGKLTLASGILNFFSLNWISTNLCLVEFFDAKRKIANKFFLYIAVFTLSFVIIWIALWIFIFMTDADSTNPDYGMIQLSVYSFITMGAGVALNFIAWKKDSRVLKLLTGIFYLLGILSIISAIVCFVYHWKYYKMNLNYVKQNLLLYTAIVSSVLVLLWIALMIVLFISNTDSINPLYPFYVYSSITMGAGVALNFVAWKKNDKVLKTLAGVSYLLGIFTIISAIICFVYAGKDKKKVGEKEIIPEKAADN